MNAVLTFETNAGAQLVALFIRAMARAVVCLLWLVLQAVGKAFALWRPVGLAALLAGIVAGCALFPFVPAAVAVVAAFAWATYPRAKGNDYAAQVVEVRNG